MGNEIFGLNEEMRDEKAEAKKNVRKPYVPWVVDGTEYRLKLTTSAIVKLENKYGQNVLSIVSPEEGLPPIGALLTVIQASMEKFEHGLSFSIVTDIYDKYVEAGGDMTTLMNDVIMPLLSNGGFFTQEMDQELMTQDTAR